MLVLIMGEFKIISLVIESKIGGPSGTTHPWPILALEPVSPYPLSLSIGQ